MLKSKPQLSASRRRIWFGALRFRLVLRGSPQELCLHCKFHKALCVVGENQLFLRVVQKITFFPNKAPAARTKHVAVLSRKPIRSIRAVHYLSGPHGFDQLFDKRRIVVGYCRQIAMTVGMAGDERKNMLVIVSGLGSSTVRQGNWQGRKLVENRVHGLDPLRIRPVRLAELLPLSGLIHSPTHFTSEVPP